LLEKQIRSLARRLVRQRLQRRPATLRKAGHGLQKLGKIAGRAGTEPAMGATRQPCQLLEGDRRLRVCAFLEEEKRHADAKRFARLLVSEIKLYNEHHVIEGRGNRDLYLRLKRDIDRSREMYEKRISPIVSQKIDYFHDEIIRILGDNDPSTLGSDYPGPRVES